MGKRFLGPFLGFCQVRGGTNGEMNGFGSFLSCKVKECAQDREQRGFFQPILERKPGNRCKRLRNRVREDLFWVFRGKARE